MVHVRQSIRDKVVTAGTRSSNTGRNVFCSQVSLLGTNKLPVLCVFTYNETLQFTRLDRVRDIDRTYRHGLKTARIRLRGYEPNHSEPLDGFAVPNLPTRKILGDELIKHIKTRHPTRKKAKDARVLEGKMIGLEELGHINLQLARMCQGFNMHVRAYDPNAPASAMKEQGVAKITDLNERMALSDVVAVCLPLNAETRDRL